MSRAKIASSIVLSLIALAGTAAADTILVDGEPALAGDLLTFDQLPAASSPEERIAAYERALVRPLTAGEEVPRKPGPVPSFIEVAVDYSALIDPQDALGAAGPYRRERAAPPGWSLTALLMGTPGPEPVTAEVYERLGVALLSAARQARFGGEFEHATGHLLTARHVFGLADRGALASGEAPADRDHAGAGLLHRAMVGLEEILITDSQDAWQEAAGLLSRQLERTPSGPLADWALRMLYHPETYVAEEGALLRERTTVDGEVRKPVKIFAPLAPYTLSARQARIQGVVIAQAVIDRHGHVAALKAIKGLPMGLTDEALRTMATWLFEPATLAGQPVVVSYFLTLNVRL